MVDSYEVKVLTQGRINYAKDRTDALSNNPRLLQNLTCPQELGSLLQGCGASLPVAVHVDLLFRTLPSQRLPHSSGIVILHKIHVLETAHETLLDYVYGSGETSRNTYFEKCFSSN